MMRRFARTALPVALVLAALTACGEREGADPGATVPTALDAPDRSLALRAEPVYRVGGFEAPDWATFGSVTSARFDPEGKLYVLDSQAQQVTVVAPDGSFLRTVGRPGEGPEELANPISLAVLPDGAVALFDFGKRGFVVYGTDGEFRSSLRVDIEDIGPPSRDVVYHPSGGLLAGTNAFVRISPGGEADSGPPTRPLAFQPLSEDEETRIVYQAWDLPEVPTEARQNLSMSGGGSVSLAMPVERAFEPGFHVDALPDGRIAVVDSSGYRIKLIDLEGQVTGTLERPIPPTEVTERIRAAERQLRLDRMEADEAPRMTLMVRTGSGGGGGGEVDPEAVKEMQRERLESMAFADEIPAIEDMAVDSDGRIWVQRSSGVPGEDGPTDILMGDGRYMGTLPVEGPRIPEAFGPGGLVVRIETDDFDVPTLVVERLLWEEALPET